MHGRWVIAAGMGQTLRAGQRPGATPHFMRPDEAQEWSVWDAASKSMQVAPAMLVSALTPELAARVKGIYDERHLGVGCALAPRRPVDRCQDRMSADFGRKSDCWYNLSRAIEACDNLGDACVGLSGTGGGVHNCGQLGRCEKYAPCYAIATAGSSLYFNTSASKGSSALERRIAGDAWARHSLDGDCPNCRDGCPPKRGANSKMMERRFKLDVATQGDKIEYS